MSRQHACPEELLAFALEGEPLNLAAHQHLAGCPWCQQQVACYQKVATYLVSRLYRSRCPSATPLSYYCLPGALSAEERHQIAEHLPHCPLSPSEHAEPHQLLKTS